MMIPISQARKQFQRLGEGNPTGSRTIIGNITIIHLCFIGKLVVMFANDIKFLKALKIP